ncbi:MAG: wax ester/triacylglycerol synthase family O-acyltransferase [Rhodococcus sp. (in: high G+C Gram-positive bacteria)]|uniref:wax ester/triacylglycerol synthase domain-containing protein n=1 Tax=Rhodococcus sp. TaxID=1831 RepID=UPI002AD95E5E|nr:wax ester/triacylglycerol synthase family O-acyltransferase [Rhodococcus sp. (in: high G+C Gram-positive bacteria)]
MQMDPRDALFLNSERTHVTQFFLTGYAFFSDGDPSDDLSPTEITDWLAERINALPELHERVVRVPWDLNHPYVEQDPDFSPSHHITFHDVTDWGSLRALIPTLVQQRIDRGLPQWHLHVARGVVGVAGRQEPATVVMVKFHHSIADGYESVRIAQKLFSVSLPVHLSTKTSRPRSRTELFCRSVLLLPITIASFARKYWQAKTTGQDMIKAEVARGDYHVKPLQSSSISLIGKLGPQREFDCIVVSVAQMREVKSALGGVTINDILLAIVSIGLSRYLKEQGEEPSHSLGAAVPISLRELVPELTSKNRFVACGVDLHSDTPDPVDRIRLIHNSAVESIKEATSPGHIFFFKRISTVPGFIFRLATRLQSRRQESSRTSAIHTGVSNIPKGVSDWKLGNSTAAASFGAISLEGNLGVAHTIDTIGDVAMINITADPELLTDIGRYRELLDEAWSELRECALTRAENQLPS